MFYCGSGFISPGALFREVCNMSLIKVENLTFSYPSSYENIFENVSFQIDTDWKLGFIGRNGRGKTSFLKLLMGEYQYQGKIVSSVKFDYFPYPLEDTGRPTRELLSQVCPQGEDWEFQRELSLLELEDEVLERPFSSLSGGERTKALLAALFLNPGHFLLIDEPTNHLDSRGRELVSAYLKKKKGFILVSHDRSFLDGCVDHILSINRADIQVQSGSFSSWMENFQRRQDFELSRNRQLQKEIKQLQQSARRSSAWSDKAESGKYGSRNSGLKVDRGYVGHKAAKMMKRSKNLEARQKKAIEEKSGLLKNVETAESLKLFPLSHHAQQLISLKDCAPAYGGREVCPRLSFSLSRGERIALDGRNGSGKSSLLKLLAGQPLEHSGSFSLASGLIVSYVPQDSSHLSGPLSAYARSASIDESLFMTILRKLDFSRSQFDLELEELSAGQKKKLMLAESLCRRAHVYLWDEPLNYIDIYSRMQIEELIKEFSPTMVFVEHDAAFRNAVATRVISL